MYKKIIKNIRKFKKSVFIKINIAFLLPIFPFFKILALLVLFVAFNDRTILIYSSSIVSVSFIVKIFSGNPYAAARKYLNLERCILSYYFLNFLLICFLSVILLAFKLKNDYYVMLIITAIKLLEAVVVSILFEKKLKNNLSGLYNKVYLLIYLLNIVIFVFLVIEGKLNYALMIDFSLLFFMFIFLFKDRFKLYKKVDKKNCLTVLKGNYDIALTVLPVSLLFLYFSSNSSTLLLGYIALAFSFAGFLNRVVSFIILSYEKINYKYLSYFSHSTSVLLTFLFLTIQSSTSTIYLYSVLMIMLSIIVAQNIVRLHAYATTNLSLVKYHTFEAALIALSFLFSEIILSLCLLLMTRTGRLFLINHE